MTPPELLQIPKSHIDMIEQIEMNDGLKAGPIKSDHFKSTMIVTKEIEGVIEVFEVSVRKLFDHTGLHEHMVP